MSAAARQDDGDEILRSMILSGQYIPTEADVRQFSWMRDAYNEHLSVKANGQLMRAFCACCGADDSHHPHCRFSR